MVTIQTPHFCDVYCYFNTARDLTSSLPQPYNIFIEEDDPILDEDQHFVEMSLGILIFDLGTKVIIFYYHFSPCDTSYSLSA